MQKKANLISLPYCIQFVKQLQTWKFQLSMNHDLENKFVISETVSDRAKQSRLFSIGFMTSKKDNRYENEANLEKCRSNISRLLPNDI